jgi:hypothetical protein
MTEIREIKSAYLRGVILQRGINDQQVISLLIVERYFREPEPTNPVVTLMLSAIDRDHPAEAAVVRRELELVKADPKAQTKENLATADAKRHALQARVAATGRVSKNSKQQQLTSGAAPQTASSTQSVEEPSPVEAMRPSLALVPTQGSVEEQSANAPSASVSRSLQSQTKPTIAL